MSRKPVPHVLVDALSYLKDQSYAGTINQVKLPDVATKTEDYDPAGVGGTIEVDLMRLEKMESEITMSEYQDRVIDLFCNPDASDEVISIHKAISTGTGTQKVVVRMQGLWKQMTFNEVKPGTVVANTFKLAVEVYELEIDGKEVLYIDKLNNVFRVNGKDRYQQIREALGQ